MQPGAKNAYDRCAGLEEPRVWCVCACVCTDGEVKQGVEVFGHDVYMGNHEVVHG